MKSELQERIDSQVIINKNLYANIPLACASDPQNKRAEPMLTAWRAGQAKMVNLQKESLEQIVLAHSPKNLKAVDERIPREITCQTYINQQNRQSREILNLIGRL